MSKIRAWLRYTKIVWALEGQRMDQGYSVSAYHTRTYRLIAARETGWRGWREPVAKLRTVSEWWV